MNILIVSAEAWRDTNNGGNVLSNVFDAFPNENIAQIYCSGETPQNALCRKYYQISDSMLLGNKKGQKLEERDYSTEFSNQSEVVENVMKGKIPGFLREAALLARECLWLVADWKTVELEQFIRVFRPDIIFAPCYSYFHISRLALYVKEIAQCPMISYISDDNYSLKQFQLSPFFWINRFATRKWIRRHFAASELIYTMTEAQMREYEQSLGRPMKVLCKSAVFEERDKKTQYPIRLMYAGGLYLNRWKILAKISKVLQKINATEVKAQLHIYSGSKLPVRHERKLNDNRSSFLHGQVPYAQLMDEYRKSDIALHVEAFDLKNRLRTRLSFSTKIIDCMNGGCALVAVGPEDQAGIAYLKENDAAVCINRMKDLPDTIEKLANCTELIREYTQKATQLGKQNHAKHEIENMLIQDFYRIAGKNSPDHIK